ncbi:FAD binding domain-containing protein [Paraburkholderia strydomiana]|jgi:carbon-monoxide dehydrogenase medium subunit|uniref:FAD binding domain-containing protein n=1 Tax=Paraburkholderia strydomiana TaxID=1245417 RepID=UPI0038BA5FDD
MKAAIYDYAKPATCDSAVAIVSPTEGMAKFVAGGQSLGPMMNLRLAQPDMLVDLRGIAALRECRIEGDTTFFGACITHAEIEDRKWDDGTQGLMPYVARGIAYRAVRNRGTLGGSLAHADPAADWINTMVALDAELLVAGPNGSRSLAAGDWMSGAFTTALEPDEILTGVRVRRLSSAARWAYYKFNRKPGEFAEAIAIVVDDAPAGICRAVIGAIDGPPYLIANARALLDSADAVLLDPHLDAAGLEAGSYEYQVHRVALERASAMVRDNRKQT